MPKRRAKKPVKATGPGKPPQVPTQQQQKPSFMDHEIEVEPQIAAIRAVRDVWIERLVTELRLLRSCFNEEQLKKPVLQVFDETLPNLSVVNDVGNKKFDVRWKERGEGSRMSMNCGGDGRDVHASLLQRLSSAFPECSASIPRLGGFEYSSNGGRTSFMGADNLNFKDIVMEEPSESQMQAMQEALRTPGVNSQRLSVGMTPKTLRLPKPGEMLLSVHGSPLGVFKENNMEAINAIEFSERLSYFGIATSSVLYLTKFLNQDLKSAARNVNYWSGVTTLMPLLGGFIADAYLGRYSTVFTSSIVYLMGLVLLTLSWFLACLKPCDHASTCSEPRRIHKVAFFLAIYLISIGTGGHRPSLESFGADQFDEDHSKERLQKMSFFNWWNCGLCSGLIMGVTVIVYVQENVNWGVADIIFTVVMAFSLAIFVIGRPFYRFRKPIGSPLTPMLQVLVAAFNKRNLPYPSSNPAAELYEAPMINNDGARRRLLCHTEKLKFLDKAAILENDGNSVENQSPWKLVTITKVEETKLIINMIPIWVFTIPSGICVAQTSTFFIKQGATLNRKLGNNGFEIPPPSIFSLAAFGMIISVAIYDKILVPIFRRVNKNERGINILQRIGFGMIFSIGTMIVAAIIEKRRLEEANESDPLKGSLSTMSVFWLAPQFLLIGFGDGFTLVGLQEYFYDQVPDSMRSLGIAFYLSVIGAANLISSLLITLVDHITEKSGKSWFGKDLNSSRLDKFYWLLAAITTVNLFLFVFFARRYNYKTVQKVAMAECYEGKSDSRVDVVGSMV